MYIYGKSDIIKSSKEKQPEKKRRKLMKYYKIYSNCCTVPHPVQDVTYKKDEILSQAIDYQYDEFLNSNGTSIVGIDDEIEKMYEAAKDEDADDQLLDELYGKIADALAEEFERNGSIAAGDWGLVALEDNEDAWAHRPNVW